MAPAFPRVQAAAIDGRFDTIYHRQVELESLCKALIDNVNEIKQAIAADSGHTPAEVAVEYHRALLAVKRDYATLEPVKAHEQEYLIANGKDASDRRTPAGVVYIEPTTHTLFYSTIAPLSAALAAGNTVIVLLENNLRAVPGLLRKLLTASLDADAVAVASKPVPDNDLPASAIRVLQNGIDGIPRLNQLTSRSGSAVVAVVDRTADVKLAARELVAARFRFGGRSPYAPDVVLVNEFAKKDFLHAVVSETVQVLNTAGSKQEQVGDSIKRLQESNPNMRIISQEGTAAVVELSSRTGLVGTKMSAPIFAIHAVKSLDDAIDLVGSQSTAPALAAYHFGNPKTGKYLSQFIAAEASFVNHVPHELLIGPAWPSGRRVDTACHYPIEAFSVARPVAIQPSTPSEQMASALSTKSSNTQTQKQLTAEATAPLKTFKRNPGGGVGFFEQGFLYNAGLLLVSTVMVSATGGFWLWRNSRRGM